MTDNGKQDTNDKAEGVGVDGPVDGPDGGNEKESLAVRSAKVRRHNFKRLVMLAVVVAVAGYFIVTKMEAFGNLMFVMFGFGTVVLVHEFGHFIVAKLRDIEVEAFSLFMPPTIFGIKRTEKGWRFRFLPGFLRSMDKKSDGSVTSFTAGGPCKKGETEYQIGLIPFGGFVKMLGQEDIGENKTSDNPRSFSNKGIGTRLAVIAAGVTFNMITAVVIFVTVFSIGVELPAPIVGSVTPDSPAALAGIEPGDEVIGINGKTKDLDFSNVAIAAALSDVNEVVEMRIRHEDGNEQSYELMAEEIEGSSYRGFGIGTPFGLKIWPNTPWALSPNT